MSFSSQVEVKAAVALASSMQNFSGKRRNLIDCSCAAFLCAALDVGRRSEIDAAYQEGSQFLQSIGIESKGEIARILDIAMNPNSLFLTLRDKKRAINVHVSTPHVLR